MSPEAQDLISRMLTLDPEQRITLEGVWAHPWVASAPRWEPPGVGTGCLYRALTDPATGAVLPDDAGEPWRLAARKVQHSSLHRWPDVHAAFVCTFDAALVCTFDAALVCTFDALQTT